MDEDNSETALARVLDEAPGQLLRLIPGLETMAAMAAVMFGDNDATVAEAFVGVLQDQLNEHKRRLDGLEAELRGQGMRLEQIDQIQKTAQARELVESLVRGAGVRKRKALINLSARLQDPRTEEARRKYFWRTLRDMPDEFLEALLLLKGGAKTIDGKKLTPEDEIILDLGTRYPNLASSFETSELTAVRRAGRSATAALSKTGESFVDLIGPL